MEDDGEPGIPHGPSQRPTPEQGRQGQNIKGMVTVLVVSLAAVVIGFVLVLTLTPAPDAKQNEASVSQP